MFGLEGLKNLLGSRVTTELQKRQDGDPWRLSWRAHLAQGLHERGIAEVLRRIAAGRPGRVADVIVQSQQATRDPDRFNGRWWSDDRPGMKPSQWTRNPVLIILRTA
jgi:hypothetical protein